MNRILDKYFAKKAMEILRTRSAIVCCDKKIVRTKQGYEFWVKNRKLNDNNWKLAYVCNFEDGLERCMQWYFADEIPEYINMEVNKETGIKNC